MGTLLVYAGDAACQSSFWSIAPCNAAVKLLLGVFVDSCCFSFSILVSGKNGMVWIVGSLQFSIILCGRNAG